MSALDSLKWIKDDVVLSEFFKKMSLGDELDSEAYSVLLSCAIVFLRTYEKDHRRRAFFEFGYYIVLCYSLKTRDYQPLFDVASSFGFYPISKLLMKNDFIRPDGVGYSLVDLKLEKYLHGGITETFDQHKCRGEILKNKSSNVSYIAPTSFGKSSLISELVDNLSLPRVAIIVPTKSLLVQTFRFINSKFDSVRVICHDEMYTENENFIAVLTQERALRLLKNKGAHFDAILVDEAHNIFDKSPRSILLSRLLRRNRIRCPEAKYYYFSPLVGDSGNLRLEEMQKVSESRIKFNIKEPEINEYCLDGTVYRYDRFIDEFHEKYSCSSFDKYIHGEARDNNFIYILSPKKIEDFSRLFHSILDDQSSGELDLLSNTISKNVHSDFYCVDYVKMGLLYIHGRMPDLIKEYLEYKFKTVDDIKYLVANTVILEGVNLPVDNLFIMNTWGLDVSDLWNLIGRVNRLNEVFGEGGGLDKLRSHIHFVDTEEFNSNNMRNKISMLGSTVFKDKVGNPTMPSFDLSKFEKTVMKADKGDGSKAAATISNVKSVIDRESYLVGLGDTEEVALRTLILESGLDLNYEDVECVIKVLEPRVESLPRQTGWSTIRVLDKVSKFFIEGVEAEIRDSSFLRLKNEMARNFYTVFIENLHNLSLKEHINSTVKYFYHLISKGKGDEFYIGRSYGEKARLDENGSPSGPPHYINLSGKSTKELVNLALVKIKTEGDYVSFKLNQYVSILFELELVTEEEYNLFVFGSTKRDNAELVKLGLSGSLINRLDKDEQLVNMSVSKFGEISINTEFRKYLVQQDDLMQFEVKKYIDM